MIQQVVIDFREASAMYPGGNHHAVGQAEEVEIFLNQAEALRR
jgi:hypothetical protein